MQHRGERTTPRAYADPYIAGVGLGLVLLVAFVVMGRGLGASGAFASVAAATVSAAAPDYASTNSLFSRYLVAGASPWLDWLVVEIVGVMLGGAVSARLAGRFRFSVDTGPRTSTNGRLATALAGGAGMGVGAILARGCTSGLALTGGALLSVGSWLFIVAAFAGGYAAIPLFRRLWT